MPARPVTVMKLQERQLPVERGLTGAVSLYREEQIGFEVGGRVLAVEDVGVEARGPAYDEKGELVRQGEPIASLDQVASDGRDARERRVAYLSDGDDRS